MAGDTVSFERLDGIAVVTLNRPDRLNAVSLGLVDDLHEVCGELEQELSTRVVVLTGAERAFCSGTDLRDDAAAAWPEDVGPVQTRYRIQQRISSLAARLRELPQPLIAAVHGPAAGAGLSLALACDLRVADTTARFNAAYIRIGLSAGDVGSSWFLPRVIGPSAAAELLYTGRFVDAEEARELGLVDRLAEEGRDVDAARDLATEILQNSPLGIRMTKELLNVSLDAPGLRQHLQVENRTQVLVSMTDDFVEGATSFAEKRDPDFRDR